MMACNSCPYRDVMIRRFCLYMDNWMKRRQLHVKVRIKPQFCWTKDVSAYAGFFYLSLSFGPVPPLDLPLYLTRTICLFPTRKLWSLEPRVVRSIPQTVLLRSTGGLKFPLLGQLSSYASTSCSNTCQQVSAGPSPKD